MAILISPDQINLSALTIPAVYLVVQPPQASITGAPASVVGRIGTASWGPVNIPVLVGDLNVQNSQFGGVSAASLTDPSDMATDTWVALQQASTAGISSQQVRVTDGTDTQASLVLNDNLADTITVTIGTSSSPTADDIVTLIFTNSQITGSPVHIAYTVVDADTTSIIAAALKTEINASSALAAAGITATVSSAVITVHANTDLDIIPVITYTLSMDATETVVISAGSAVVGGTLTALYSGILGNQIKVSILPGTGSSFVNVLLTAWSGKAQELYMGLPNSSAFWAALQSALSSGIGSQRPPSNLARFAPASSTHAPQLLVAHALSGGTDGRSVDSAELVGSPTGGPNAQGSGLYALLRAIPSPQQAWCVGLTDMTVAPTIQSFAVQNGILCFISEPIGTTVSQTVSDLQNYGINSYEVVTLIDWPQLFDAVNNVSRFVPPTGAGGGLCSALSPEQSPLNKPMEGILTTYQFQNFGPYQDADISLANTNGVALFCNPIGRGPGFGFITAVNTSLNNIGTAPIEYSRMTNFLIQSVGANLGQYLGALQSQQPVDPVRSAIKSNLNTFLAQLESNKQLDDHVVLCEFSQTNNSPGYNTPATIAEHICSVFVAATYLSSIWYLIFTLQGGTTVSVQNVVSTQPAS
jgi:uncharacterized protein